MSNEPAELRLWRRRYHRAKKKNVKLQHQVLSLQAALQQRKDEWLCPECGKCLREWDTRQEVYDCELCRLRAA